MPGWCHRRSSQITRSCTATVQFVPHEPILDNYRNALLKQPVGRTLLNSVIVSGAETLAVVVTSVFIAYPFARLRFPGRDLLFLLILGTMMIPSQVTMTRLSS